MRAYLKALYKYSSFPFLSFPFLSFPFFCWFQSLLIRHQSHHRDNVFLLLGRGTSDANQQSQHYIKLEMWANAQRDGRPAEYRWRPLFNAAVWLTPTTRVPCSNAAKTRNPLKVPGVPQTNERISAASGPKFTILWGHVGEILLLKKFFPIVDACLSCKDIAGQSCAMVPRW